MTMSSEHELVTSEHQLVTDCAFALLQPLVVDKSLWSDLPHLRLLPCFYADTTGQLPVLVRLNDLSDDQRAKLIQRIEDWNLDNHLPFFCAFLSSNDSAERLHQTLSRQLLQEMPDRSKSLLRYYDPLVFQHLCWILNPTQLAALLGPCEAWYWRDAGGQWQCQERPPLRTYFLSLRTHQLEALGRTRLLNRALKQLRPALPKQVFDANTFRWIDELLQQALAEEGLSREADRILYVQHLLTYHLHIHRHPVLRANLEKARAGQTTYVRACKTPTDAELRAFVLRGVHSYMEPT